jgi:serine phosphatase RsbU (regulator of sigma subunit)/PAS domain-containing protein
MSERKRFLLLILIMTSVSLVVGGIAIVLLYRAALDESRQRLIETAESQARLIEAVARFDRVWSVDYPEGWVSATLGQITDAHDRYKGFGKTGEFTLARRDGDDIVFLLSHRHADLGSPKPVPFKSALAEPMRRALLGQSGTVIGLDYRGTRVVAAHEPVAELDLGIVAKIDIAEVRAPFIKASLFAAGSGLLVVLLGSALFIRTSNPILRRLQDLYEKSQQELAERKRAEEALRNANEQLEQRVHERTAELASANEDLRGEIEERSRTEVALRASEATFAAVFKSAPVMLMLLDENRNVRAANPAATSVFSNWGEQAVERRFGHAVQCAHSLDSPQGCGFGGECERCPIRRLVEQTFQTGRPSQAHEVQLTRRVGDEVQDAHFLVTTSLPEIPERREVLVCLEDITERKQAANRIRTNLQIQEVTNAILHLALKSASREELLAKTLELIISIPWLKLESKGCVFLVSEERKALKMVAQRGLPPELLAACGTLPLGTCLCGRAAATGEIVFARNVDDQHEVRYPRMPSHGHYCVPIASEERLWGVLNLYVAAGHKRISEEETFLSSVANILAITLQRKEAEEDVREKEAQLIAAAEIQKFLLPDESVTIPGFSIAGRCYPAEFAAGDHFDYLWLPDGSLLVVLGDVSGHGVGPAIVAAAFHTRFQTLAEELSDPTEIAAKVNASLHESTNGELFVTLIAGRIDPKSRTLTYVNAGHPPGLILDSAGEVKASLDGKNMPLAILPEVDFILGGPVQLETGDMVLFFTDGLVEAQTRDGPMFGVERALQIVRENRDKTPTEIIEALYRAVCEYLEAERLFDDVTVVVVKVEPTEEAGAGGVATS